MKTAKEYILEQLVENTGEHFLDSGGDDGRAWQQNKGKDFEAEPVFTVDVSEGETIVTVSTYHYMKNVLEFDELTDELNETLKNNPGWVSELVENGFFKAYVDNIENLSDASNTYNWHAPLTQHLLFCTFESNGNTYVAVQTHNGADIRGGYSKVGVYKLNEWQQDWGFANIIVFAENGLDSHEGYFNEEIKENEIILSFEY